MSSTFFKLASIGKFGRLLTGGEEHTPRQTPETVRRKSLERWDNEGGAPGRPRQAETQRQVEDDTCGRRRRTRLLKARNDLI